MKQPTPPAIDDGTSPVRLSAAEFEAMLFRLSDDQKEQARSPVQDCYTFVLYPVRFWIPQPEWETALLKGILHNCQSKWKDVLTEPTLQKLRALLVDAAPAAPVAPSATSATSEREEC